MEHLEAFAAQRQRLFSIAYRMVGSVMDAEDLVQEAYFRWQGVSLEAVGSPRAYLTTIVTRLCIDHLRSARQRRETYIGPWLPEPLIETPQRSPDDLVELAESLSFAFLLLLESLAPVERAVYLLREVYAYEYAEVAQVVERSPANCRQILSRARRKIRAARPVPASLADDPAGSTRQFVDACLQGDIARLLDLLAEDVVLISDGGGKVVSARRPIAGADKVARFLIGIVRRSPPGLELRQTTVNAGPGVLASLDGQIFGVASLQMAGDRIAAVYLVQNPEKLAHLTPGFSSGHP